MQEFAGGESAVRPFVQTLWSNGALAAVWPLSRSAGVVSRVTMLGRPYSEYAALIHDSELVSEGDLSALVGRVLVPERFDLAVFDGVPDGSVLARLLPEHAPAVVCSGNESLILDLDAWTAAHAADSLSGSRRRRFERRRKQIERVGAISFDVIWPDHPDFPVLARRTIEMKRVWLRATGRVSSGGSLTGWGDFLARLSGSASERQGACISVMRAGERIVALEIGLVQRDHYYSHIAAFDWDLASASPGKIQLEFTLRWLAANGVRKYDFLANATDYKRAWSNTSQPLTNYAVPLSWKGRIYAEAWLSTLKPSIKRAFYAMPATLRRAVA